jgi:hypothetical protein
MGQSKVNVPNGCPKKAVFFGPEMAFIPEKQAPFRDVGRNLMKMNG